MFFDELRAQHRQHEAAVAQWEAVRAQLPATEPTLADGLTVCSVAFKARQCLDLNYELMRSLNPGAVELPTWLLFDNNDQPAEQLAGDPRFEIVTPVQRMGFMGYEHALGLIGLLQYIRTRYVLFLDPDCFIVRPNWVREVVDHMQANGLAFFGTPINPRRHNSYRYFPYLVCMFVDLAQVPRRELSVLPAVWNMRAAVSYRLRDSIASVPRLGALFRWLLTERWLTNAWQLRVRYADHPTLENECVQPVWDVTDTIPPRSLRRIIHNLTPASVSPVPKRPGYVSATGFRTMGAPDLDALGWEEFVWRGAPFAFHVGSVHSSKRAPYEASLLEVVEAFRRRAPAADQLISERAGALEHSEAARR
jgi:hypothetical protein